MRFRSYILTFMALLMISCRGGQTPTVITEDGRIFFSEDIPIQWQAVPGATHYLVEVSSHGDFSESELLWRADDPRILIGNGHRFNLEEGIYYYRIKPVFENPLLGKWSAVQTFTYQPLAVLSEVLPASGRSTPGGSFSFSWDLSADLQGRGFIQLATDPLFQNILWENPSVPHSPVEISDLPEGTFYIRAGFSASGESGFLFSDYHRLEVVPPVIWPVSSSVYLEEPWVELHGLDPDGRELFFRKVDGFRLIDWKVLDGGGWALLGTQDSPEKLYEIPVVLQLDFKGDLAEEFRLEELEGYQFDTLQVLSGRFYLFGNTGRKGVESQAVVCFVDRRTRKVDIRVLSPVSAINGRITEPDFSSGVDRVERHLKETAIDGFLTPDGILLGGNSQFSRTDWSGNHGRGVLIGQAGWFGLYQPNGSLTGVRTLLGPHSYGLEGYLGKLGDFQTFYGQRISGNDWTHSPILVGIDTADGKLRETDLFSANGWHPGRLLWLEQTSEIVLARHGFVYEFSYDPDSSVLVPDSIYRFSTLSESASPDILNYTDLVIDSLASCGPKQFILAGRVVAEDNLASWCLKFDASAQKILWQYSSNDDFNFSLSPYPVEKLLYGEDWQPWMPDREDGGPFAADDNSVSDGIDWAYEQKNYRIFHSRSGGEINFWATETEVFGEEPDERMMVKDLPPEQSDWHVYQLDEEAYVAFSSGQLISAFVTGEPWYVLGTYHTGMVWEDVRPLLAGKKETVPSSVLWSDLMGEYHFVYGVFTDESENGALFFYVRDDKVVGILLEVYII